MKTRPKFTQAAALPFAQGDIILRNNYDAVLCIPLSALRNLQSDCKNSDIKFKDVNSYLVLIETSSFQTQYPVRCTLDVLHKAVKLARWGYDVDLTAYSGKIAQRLDTIDPLLENFAPEEQQAILKAFESAPMRIKKSLSSKV